MRPDEPSLCLGQRQEAGNVHRCTQNFWMLDILSLLQMVFIMSPDGSGPHAGQGQEAGQGSPGG